MSDYKSLKRSEIRTIEESLGMTQGYVLDFSNRTISEFFEDEFGIDFYAEEYSKKGESKAKRLRSVLEAHSGQQSAAILRKLWDQRSTLPDYGGPAGLDNEQKTYEKYFAVLAKLSDDAAMDLSAFDAFDKSNTLYELIQSIERDIQADKPQAAMDRLHLFCVVRFRHLLAVRQIETNKDEPLNSLAGKYKKALEREGKHTEMSLLFIKYSIAVFEKFNTIRNERSLAHNNELLEVDEARFIFDAVGSVLRFIKRIDHNFDT